MMSSSNVTAPRGKMATTVEPPCTRQQGHGRRVRTEGEVADLVGALDGLPLLDGHPSRANHHRADASEGD